MQLAHALLFVVCTKKELLMQKFLCEILQSQMHEIVSFLDQQLDSKVICNFTLFQINIIYFKMFLQNLYKHNQMNPYKYVCIWLYIQKYTRYLNISRQFSLTYGKFLPLHIMQLNFNTMFLGFPAGIIFLETLLLSLFLFLNQFLWSSSTIWKSVKKTANKSHGIKQDL